MVQNFKNVMHYVPQWIHALTSYIAFCSTAKKQIWLRPTCFKRCFLWPPCTADVDILFYFVAVVSFFLFSSCILIGRRLDVYHTSTHGVAFVRI